MIAGFFVLAGLVLSFFDNIIIRAISPLWRAENRFSKALVGTFNFFRTRESLQNENTDLKARLSSLGLELSTMYLHRDENQRLLALLGRSAGEPGITAAILTHPPQSPYDLLIIDAGGFDMVEEGARVALPEGPELGIVEQVFPRYSRIKLFTTPGEQTAAVLERHQVPVTLEGLGGGNFRIVVPRDTVVSAGDRILSPEINSALLAVVAEVNVTATDSFKEVRAKSPVNIFEVRFLKILP